MKGYNVLSSLIDTQFTPKQQNNHDEKGKNHQNEYFTIKQPLRPSTRRKASLRPLRAKSP